MAFLKMEGRKCIVCWLENSTSREVFRSTKVCEYKGQGDKLNQNAYLALTLLWPRKVYKYGITFKYIYRYPFLPDILYTV